MRFAVTTTEESKINSMSEEELVRKLLTDDGQGRVFKKACLEKLLGRTVSDNRKDWN